MKKIIAILLVSAFVGKADAQVFTLIADTVKKTIATSDNIHNDITNVSTGKIRVEWKVVSHDLPSDWSSTLGICDNSMCYYNTNNSLLSGTPRTTDTISAGAKGNFYLLFDLSSASAGTHYVQVQMTSGGDTKNGWFIINKFPTGIASYSKLSADVVAYPTPASTEVTIRYDKQLDVKDIALFGVNGQLVGTYPAAQGSTVISMVGLSEGLYYAQIRDKNAQTVGAAKFSKY